MQSRILNRAYQVTCAVIHSNENETRVLCFTDQELGILPAHLLYNKKRQLQSGIL